MHRVVYGALIMFSAGACTRKNPNYCATDGECMDVTRPFCDVAGEFEESGFEDNTCTVRPAACEVERCGCTAGKVLHCEASTATVCNTDGASVSEVPCGLGCSSVDACFTFEPSNGLGPAFASATGEEDVAFPAGTIIDSDLGSATANGVAITVRSLVITQDGVAPIRAFLAKSFTIDGVTVRGQNAVAFVAAGDVIVRGILSARGTGVTAGPGSQEAPASCAGPAQPVDLAKGTGGAGNATVGGDGGGPGTASPDRRGGALIPRFEPLVGGCRGGTMSTATPAIGGAGGGGIQIVANGQVSLSNTGLIDIGGGGGDDRAGGGSGGMLVIEAPRVVIAGSAAGIVGNGGGGGGCGVRGGDGARSSVAASGSRCTKLPSEEGTASAGNGGTALAAAESAATWTACSPSIYCPLVGGGGGGAVGAARISTKTGDYEVSGNSIFSIAISRAALTPL